MVQNLGDVIRADSIMEFDGSDDQVNNFQFQQSTSGPTTDADTLADLIVVLEALYTILLPIINILITFEKIRARNLTNGTLIGEVFYSGITAGTQAGDALPPGVGPVHIFPTAIPKVILKKFMPPPSEAGNDADGRLGATGLVLHATAIAFLLAPLVGSSESYNYGYLSPKTGGFVIPTTGSIRNVMGYQRRRKQGVGS